MGYLTYWNFGGTYRHRYKLMFPLHVEWEWALMFACFASAD